MQTHNATITVPEAATGLEPVWCGVEIVRCPTRHTGENRIPVNPKVFRLDAKPGWLNLPPGARAGRRP